MPTCAKFWVRGAGWGLRAFIALGLHVAQARPEAPPLPPGTRSVEVQEEDTPVWQRPDRASERRGALRQGARLPVLDTRAAQAGCAERWLLIAPHAWLCETQGRLSKLPPQTQHTEALNGYGLPYRYYFVGANGSFGYASLRLADEGIPDSQLEPGFAVAVTQIHTKPGGEHYALTSHGLWLPVRDLVAAQVSEFKGTLLQHEPQNVAWVYTAQAKRYKSPGVAAPGPVAPRLQQVQILEQQRHAGQTWLKVGNEYWLRASDVRRVQPQPAPADIGATEPWVDVNTQTQVLTAYIGALPVFATLVSTGKGAQGVETATPVGEHRIWVKLATHDMTNLEDPAGLNLYAIEEVPWVMFFKQGYGLHAAFWHNSFGQKRSHGCVNLSPQDAHFLFQLLGPQLPPGWRAVLPVAKEAGTRVIVR